MMVITMMMITQIIIKITKMIMMTVSIMTMLIMIRMTVTDAKSVKKQNTTDFGCWNDGCPDLINHRIPPCF